MIKKDSSERVICVACSDVAIEGSEYCQACTDVGSEKLGLFIPDMFEEFETLRGGVDAAADTLAGVNNE